MIKYLLCLLFPLHVYALNIGVVGDSNSSPYFVTEDELYYRLVEKKLNHEGHSIKFYNATIATEPACLSNSLSRLIALHEHYKLDAVLISLGVNDAGKQECAAQSSVYLFQMLDYCKEHKIDILLGTVDISFYKWPCDEVYLQNFHQIYLMAEKSYSVQSFPFIFYTFFSAPVNHIGDMVHASANGHKVWAAMLEHQVKQYLKNICLLDPWSYIPPRPHRRVPLGN